ncbi:toll/interleukin-1 receptor domain-containing protein [Hoeflea ulvae]|uniref:Toll/interleukin-1 receptor domain-containing protein n=1 Tax=Hoeflea ulvae TaxID=2983764 RepID=A0ABT3YIJ9_9HYPH|nr:toll/interleukin-1 receptor domain-containing protein [Hoeflea ulvae]MCY0095725.1 toll/interleukin-1 receptor domain-containing protein [Hoeflea ulvae]
MIDQALIRAFAASAEFEKSGAIVNQALRSGKQTAFLCHSRKDATLARGLQGFLQSKGWMVYIDWEGSAMQPTPSPLTAQNTRERIKRLDWFVYLATAHSAASRWCGWEMGYADAVKPADRILIIPTYDSDSKPHGREFMDLYRHISVAAQGGYGVFDPVTRRGPLLQRLKPGKPGPDG